MTTTLRRRANRSLTAQRGYGWTLYVTAAQREEIVQRRMRQLAARG